MLCDDEFANDKQINDYVPRMIFSTFVHLIIEEKGASNMVGVRSTARYFGCQAKWPVSELLLYVSRGHGAV